MRFIKITLLVMAGIFLAIQLLPDRLPENKAMDTNHISGSGLLTNDVSTILETSCFDCHSFQTQYPWYAKVAPSSWFLARHITEGREELNFSEWESYSMRKKISMLEAINTEVESGKMPLKSYLLLHKYAALDTAELAAIKIWTEETGVKLLQ
jgi:hypothetical protein